MVTLTGVVWPGVVVGAADVLVGAAGVVVGAADVVVGAADVVVGAADVVVGAWVVISLQVSPSPSKPFYRAQKYFRGIFFTQ